MIYLLLLSQLDYLLAGLIDISDLVILFSKLKSATKSLRVFQETYDIVSVSHIQFILPSQNYISSKAVYGAQSAQSICVNREDV